MFSNIYIHIYTHIHITHTHAHEGFSIILDKTLRKNIKGKEEMDKLGNIN